jgi:hypothetical protein
MAAAMVMMFAVSAVASNFRVADQVYVPAAGKVGNFATDVFVSNVNAFPVTVSVIYSTGVGGTQTNFANLFTLQANERKEFVDFVGTAPPNGLGLSGALGALVFNGCKQGADCGVGTQDPTTGVSLNFADISVESRIYATGAIAGLPSGTTGQLFSGLPWYNFVSQDQQNNGLDTVFITGIRSTGSGPGTYRTNLGLVNASQFSNTQIVLKLFRGDGTKIGADKIVPLGPLGVLSPTNVTDLFGSVATGTNLYVTVSQQNSSATGDAPISCGTSGCAGFYAYGSVLDNTTTDATTLESQYTKSLTAAQIGCIYPDPTVTQQCKGVSKMRRSVKH